eukprot:TRINITY_DN6753_c0_g1_i1.p1 TRINITY_DN6753_c0_g1~~TRINITY_DN6753_c0_g1_i1.p1  ORF type:complete len:509 (-),score=83.41 TRINITY_DN6753_c0_g1_i1:558-2084(-)
MQSVLAIDVGTGSVRCALFTIDGTRMALHTEPTTTWNSTHLHYEQSFDEIWDKCGVVVRKCLDDVPAARETVCGVSFTATCSLVLVGENNVPVSASLDGDPRRNIILWMDHRALKEANYINELKHERLRFVGGRLSPEMQLPKILWLQRHLPLSYSRVRRFFDLPDMLTFKATGCEARSLCTTTCKWTYAVPHSSINHNLQSKQVGQSCNSTKAKQTTYGVEGWSESFLQQCGLSDLCKDSFECIGSVVQALGTAHQSPLSFDVASQWTLSRQNISVAVSAIDAHAGGIGLLGVGIPVGLRGENQIPIEEKLALIAGTSNCHMVASKDAYFVPGVWGPYYGAMIPDLWLSEGGQSASGSLLQHIVEGHAAYTDLQLKAKLQGIHIHSLLNDNIETMRHQKNLQESAFLTKELHCLPYFHGNRSPLADPTLKGMFSGLTLSHDSDDLTLKYYAAVQALAYGTRHIIESMEQAGHKISAILVTGGLAHNRVFLQEHADVTGLPVVVRPVL